MYHCGRKYNDNFISKSTSKPSLHFRSEWQYEQSSDRSTPSSKHHHHHHLSIKQPRTPARRDKYRPARSARATQSIFLVWQAAPPCSPRAGIYLETAVGRKTAPLLCGGGSGGLSCLENGAEYGYFTSDTSLLELYYQRSIRLINMT